MKLSIYVVTQKKYDFELPHDYYWIQSGTSLNEPIQGIIHDNDNSNDNRSNMNPYYSEYSAHYHIWKNDNHSDAIGISHYRRFFAQNSFSFKQINKKKITKIFKRYDVILPIKEYHPAGLYNQFVQSHGEQEIKILLDTLKEYDLDFYNFFKKKLNNKNISLRNIFIGKSFVIKDYWSWIFPLFDLLEPKLDFSNKDNYQKRVYGYLAERLFEAWFMYKNYKIKYCYIFNTDEKNSLFRRFGQFVKRCLRR